MAGRAEKNCPTSPRPLDVAADEIGVVRSSSAGGGPRRHTPQPGAKHRSASFFQSCLGRPFGTAKDSTVCFPGGAGIRRRLGQRRRAEPSLRPPARKGVFPARRRWTVPARRFVNQGIGPSSAGRSNAHASNGTLQGAAAPAISPAILSWRGWVAGDGPRLGVPAFDARPDYGRRRAISNTPPAIGAFSARPREWQPTA